MTLLKKFYKNRFNAEFAQRLYDYQPVNVDPSIQNSVKYLFTLKKP
jgi:hypothetical protein